MVAKLYMAIDSELKIKQNRFTSAERDKFHVQRNYNNITIGKKMSSTEESLFGECDFIFGMVSFSDSYKKTVIRRTDRQTMTKRKRTNNNVQSTTQKSKTLRNTNSLKSAMTS